MSITVYLTQFLAASIASCSFSILLNISPKNIFLAGIGGGVTWILYLILINITNSIPIAAFFASTFAAIYSDILGKIYKKPAIVFLISGIICLVPGADMYKTMLYSITKTTEETITQAFIALYTAGAIATGVAFPTSLLMMLKKANKLARNKNT